MENSAFLAQRLVKYLIATYGEKQYLLLKQLCALPLFESLVNDKKLFKLLRKKNMLSIEYVYKRSTGIYWKRDTTKLCVSVYNGSTVRVFEDDKCGTVAAYFRNMACKSLSQSHNFVSSAIIQSGGGVDVDDIVDSFDHALFGSLYREAYRAIGDDYTKALDNYDKAYANYNGRPGFVNKCMLAEAVHGIFSKLRIDARDVTIDTGEGILPFVKRNEYEQFLAGSLKRSFKSKGPLTEDQLEKLINLYGQPVKTNENEVYFGDQKKIKKSIFSLIDSHPIELPHSFDAIFGATEVVLEPMFDEEPEQLAPDFSDDEEGEPSVPIPRDVGVNFMEQSRAIVEQYWNVDKIEKEDKTEAYFGTAEGMALWNGLSKGARDKYLKTFQEREYTLDEWLEHGASVIEKSIGKRKKIGSGTLLKLAAGRIIAQKQALDVCLTEFPQTIQKA